MTQEQKIQWMKTVRQEAVGWYAWLDHHVTEDKHRAVVIPEMNAQGMNTALSTRPTATTGPDTCSMARIVASRGARPFSM